MPLVAPGSPLRIIGTTFARWFSTSTTYPTIEATMSTFTPEFAQQWLAAPADDDEWRVDEDDEAPSASQQEALMELADLVSAARSVV
jgi:hypothetical protein